MKRTNQKYDMILMSSVKPYRAGTRSVARAARRLCSVLDTESRRTLVSMLRRAMTADRVEKVFMLTGSGRNGKGLIMNYFEGLLGDYAYKAPLAVLTSAQKTGANQEVANMHMKRFVRFSEPDASITSAPLKFSRLKELSGDDTTAARGIYSRNTTTELRCVLLIDLNRLMRMDGDLSDDAAAEQIEIIDFPYTFTADREKIAAQPDKYKPKDESLKSKQEYFRCALFKYLYESSEGITMLDDAAMPDPSLAVYVDAQSKASAARYLQRTIRCPTSF